VPITIHSCIQSNKGNSFRSIEIPVGSYELRQINDVITSEVGTLIEIKPNTATLHSMITISDVNVQVEHEQVNAENSSCFNATTTEG